MTRPNERHLFTLVTRFNGVEHKVYMWKGYGVVCPTLWTTNGDMRDAARQISDSIRMGRCTVTESKLKPGFDFMDYVVLKAEFERMHREWLNPPQPKPEPEPPQS